MTFRMQAMGFGRGTHGGTKVRESLEKSLRDLGVAQVCRTCRACACAVADRAARKVNIFYLHAPDRETPFKHVLEQLDTLYREGKFAKLGLSNYSGAEVQEFCEVSSCLLASRFWIFSQHFFASLSSPPPTISSSRASTKATTVHCAAVARSNSSPSCERMGWHSTLTVH